MTEDEHVAPMDSEVEGDTGGTLSDPVPVLVVEAKRRSRVKAKTAPLPQSPPTLPKPKRVARPRKVKPEEVVPEAVETPPVELVELPIKPQAKRVVKPKSQEEAHPREPLHQLPQPVDFHSFSSSIRELHRLGEESKRARYQSLLAGMT